MQTAATIGACAWLIPLFGLTGAAVATMVTSVIHAVGGFLIVERALRSLESDVRAGRALTGGMSYRG